MSSSAHSPAATSRVRALRKFRFIVIAPAGLTWLRYGVTDFRATRLAHDEINRHHFLYSFRLAMDQLNETFAALFADLVQRLVNGRQPGNRVACLRDVVEPDHRNVLRHAQSQLAEFLHRAEGHLVVER